MTALEQIKRRGTFEACDGLSRIELRMPQHRWLRFHFDEAEAIACAITWEPPKPRELLKMETDRLKRFVDSSDQLIEAVTESLNRLQAELHGELASVGDMWNSRAAEWWPKQEEDVSDYVARFLRRDLASRGIIVNREVQIRRGKLGEMKGQNTDIHVDAVDLNASGHTYGTIKLIIEVKGSWNASLTTDMEEQLRDQYMKNNDCTAGLYLVAHFSAKNWARWDNRRASSSKWTVDGLRENLSKQANDLSSIIHIRSLVLNIALDSTKAQVAK